MSEETYNAMKTGCMWLGEYIKDIAEAVGWEKAIEIWKLGGHRRGKAAVEFYKTHDPMTRLEEHAINTMAFQDPMGWETTYEATPSEVTYRIKVCPLFDGFLEAGIPVERINALCKSTHIAMDEELKNAFPQAEFTSVPKPSKENHCIETIKLPL